LIYNDLKGKKNPLFEDFTVRFGDSLYLGKPFVKEGLITIYSLNNFI